MSSINVTNVHIRVSGENPGPFSLLQTCRCAGRRVKVTIRHCAGVRGMCEGVPVVYDRHMNIVLRDVTEWCTPIRTVANGGITLSKSKRQRKKKRTEQSSKERSGELNEGHSEGNIEQDTSLVSIIYSYINTCTGHLLPGSLLCI